MKKLSLAYFGTPDFSARFLEKLLNDKDLPVEVKLVVTQPDKKIGRRQILTPSPVKQLVSSRSTHNFLMQLEPPRIREVQSHKKISIFTSYYFYSSY